MTPNLSLNDPAFVGIVGGAGEQCAQTDGDELYKWYRNKHRR